MQKLIQLSIILIFSFNISYSQNLTSLTMTDDANNLTVTVIGSLLEATYDAFIDIDNDPATGYSAGQITGADFLIQNGTIFFYSGVAPGWGWTQTTGMTVTDGAGSREFVIDRATLGLTDAGTTINALYQNTINFSPTDVIPETGMLAYTTTTAIAGPNLSSLTLTDDEDNLTMTVLGDVIEATYDAFIDIDNDPATGYSAGQITGADFLIQNGTIFFYSGVAPGWGWTQTTGVTITDIPGSRAIVIDRATLGLTDAGTTVNALYQNTINFSPTDVIPETGMLAYTTTTAIAIPNLASMTLSDDNNDLTITIEGSNIITTYEAFIDIDNNSGTGYLGGSIAGAEFYINAGQMYPYTGAAQQWGWGTPTAVTVNDQSARGMMMNSREIIIPKSDLGLTTAGTTINTLYQSSGTSDVLPTSGMQSYVTTSESILPVELVQFKGALLDQSSIILEWKTRSEINNELFEIEHSTNGKTFTNIGQVSGKDNTVEIQHYSFLDRNVYPGLNYYRLKQIDYNGTYELSDVITLSIRQAQISIVPNPAQDMISIISPVLTDQKFGIYNMGGKLLLNGYVNNPQIDISSLPTGVYLFKSGQITQKLVKAKY